MGLSKVQTILLAVVISISGCFLFEAPAFADMRIFELQHHPAAKIAETVRALIGEDARIAVHRNTLAVRSTPEVINEVAALIAYYDKPLSMLRITVEQGRDTEIYTQRGSASGQLQAGSVNVGIPSAPTLGDTSIFVTSGNAQVRMSGTGVVHDERRQVSQFVSVLDGSPALILIGRAIPFTSQLRYYSRQHPHFVESIEYQRVDTGFEVLPEVVGDQVRLQINPFMSFLDKTSPNQIVYQEMTSVLNIPLGSWSDLSAHLGKEGGLNLEILGAGTGAGSDSSHVRIRIDKAP